MKSKWNQPEARAQLESNGFDVVGSTPEELRAFLATDIPRRAA